MIATLTGLKVGEFVHSIGDAHLYLNHIEQAKIQIKRTPKLLPNLIIKNKPENIEGFNFEDFEFKNYNFDPHISAPIAV